MWIAMMHIVAKYKSACPMMKRLPQNYKMIV